MVKTLDQDVVVYLDTINSIQTFSKSTYGAVISKTSSFKRTALFPNSSASKEA